jgi:hypothetical protein
MPKVVKAYPITIGYRDSAAGAQKLEELAKRTGRPRAEVLRLLVSLAEATDLPAVRFVTPMASAEVCERAPACTNLNQ